MLAIGMRRAGAKNRPFFRIVVTEAKSAREGRFVEVLGHYDPRTKPETVKNGTNRHLRLRVRPFHKAHDK